MYGKTYLLYKDIMAQTLNLIKNIFIEFLLKNA